MRKDLSLLLSVG